MWNQLGSLKTYLIPVNVFNTFGIRVATGRVNVYRSAIFCGQALLHFLGSEEGEAAVDRVLFYQLNACLNENQSEMTYERIVTRQTMHKKFGHCVSWETSVNSSCELNIIILTCASKTAIVRVAFGILISPSREIGHWSNWNRDIEVLAGRDIHWELTAGVHCIISVTTNQTNRIAKHSACHLKITMRLVLTERRASNSLQCSHTRNVILQPVALSTRIEARSRST